MSKQICTRTANFAVRPQIPVFGMLGPQQMPSSRSARDSGAILCELATIAVMQICMRITSRFAKLRFSVLPVTLQRSEQQWLWLVWTSQLYSHIVLALCNPFLLHDIATNCAQIFKDITSTTNITLLFAIFCSGHICTFSKRETSYVLERPVNSLITVHTKPC